MGFMVDNHTLALTLGCYNYNLQWGGGYSKVKTNARMLRKITLCAHFGPPQRRSIREVHSYIILWRQIVIVPSFPPSLAHSSPSLPCSLLPLPPSLPPPSPHLHSPSQQWMETMGSATKMQGSSSLLATVIRPFCFETLNTNWKWWYSDTMSHLATLRKSFRYVCKAVLQ